MKKIILFLLITVSLFCREFGLSAVKDEFGDPTDEFVVDAEIHDNYTDCRVVIESCGTGFYDTRLRITNNNVSRYSIFTYVKIKVGTTTIDSDELYIVVPRGDEYTYGTIGIGMQPETWKLIVDEMIKGGDLKVYIRPIGDPALLFAVETGPDFKEIYTGINILKR